MFYLQESWTALEKVKRRYESDLENKYCIISFKPETHEGHRRIVKACLEGRRREKSMTESGIVIKDQKSVLKLPPGKVMLVFVDYNEFNIILGTPGQDINDIKLLTVQACRKMGGRLRLSTCIMCCTKYL